MNQPAGPVNPDARRARWHGHREARRAELVEAAVRAIRRHGAGVGMDDIAAEAGVSKPVLYRYFADKADLYLAVGRRSARLLLETVDAELRHDREPHAHLATVIDAYLRAIEAEPQLYRFVVRPSFADRPVEDDPVADYTELIALKVSALVGERLRAAGLDDSAAAAWGHGVVGMVQAAGHWWLDQATVRREDLTEQLAGLLWNGFGRILAGDAHVPGGSTAATAGPTPRPDTGPTTATIDREPS